MTIRAAVWDLCFSSGKTDLREHFKLALRPFLLRGWDLTETRILVGTRHELLGWMHVFQQSMFCFHFCVQKLELESSLLKERFDVLIQRKHISGGTWCTLQTWTMQKVIFCAGFGTNETRVSCGTNMIDVSVCAFDQLSHMCTKWTSSYSSYVEIKERIKPSSCMGG